MILSKNMKKMGLYKQIAQMQWKGKCSKLGAHAGAKVCKKQGDWDGERG